MASPPVVSNALVQHMARLHKQSPLFVALFDATDTTRYANPAFLSIFGLSTYAGLTWSDLMRHSYMSGVGAAIKTDDFEAWLTSTRSRRGKLPFRAFETDLTDGRWIYITETVDEQGWVLHVAFDISAMRTSERALRQARDGALRAAQTDALTGISNRAHILQQLDQRLEQLRTSGQTCGVVILDLDHFKCVNDTHGHHAGDLVLTHFARLVAGTLRREDGFGRLGGEEFMLLFPNIEAAALTLTVSRVLELVRAAAPLSDVPDFSYTCSAGVAMLKAELDAKANICNADRAAYAAKANGRDRLEWAA
ncbi:diguanylate cyclase domain-containing protein [Rhodoferax saidenbachensis]|uniref:diguanylate cyclase n=1 Tax=Rhodoferax saidenbachensis TaxID=1484693 RepID=A0ABU1ZQ90_9BURK|nr:diguanylate cyclase [Rhodoferax saidenbachensis]MDR7307658.1 diguanylate cyclase (GGDEF)-like protein [Rhodoferax saidenbachensis]